MVNDKKEESEVKKHLLHIAFSESELETIKKYSKDIGITMSEFLRESIRDKIMRIEHPEIANTKSIVNIESILEMISDNKIEIKKIAKKLDIISEIKNNVSVLTSMVNRPALLEKELKIIDLLKERKELRPKEISNLLRYSIEDVYSIISNDKRFSVNIKTGGITLYE